MKKRIPAIFLVLVMLVTMMPAVVFANGSGEPECTCTEACNIENHPYSGEDGACPVCSSYETYTIEGVDKTFYKMGYLDCKHLKETVYVDSETGLDTNSGDVNSPVANLQMALYKLKPGGEIIVTSEMLSSFSPSSQAWQGIVMNNFIIDRAATIKAAEGVSPEYAGKVTTAISGTFGTNPGTPFVPKTFDPSNPTKSSFLEGGAKAARWYNNPEGVVTFDGITFTNTGGDIISSYTNASDLSNFELIVQNCKFTNVQSGSAIRLSRDLKGLTLKNTDFTVTRDPNSENGYQKAYMVWTDTNRKLIISDCNFDGNGSYRAAIHVGNGHSEGTTAQIENNSFKGFERCIQLALINSAKNTTNIKDNIFENIQLSKATKNTTNAYEYGAVFIHESHQQYGNFDSAVSMTGNKLTGTSDRWIYTENIRPIEYFNITIDGSLVGNMDFHRHLADDGDVTYYPLYPVLAPVADGTAGSHNGYILKTADAAFSEASDDDTLALLRDVTLNGVDTPENNTAEITVDNNLALVLAPEITLSVPESSNSFTINNGKTLTLPGWYEGNATDNDDEFGGSLVIGDHAALNVNGVLLNKGNVVLNGTENTNLTGKITLAPGGEVYSLLNRGGQVLNWIKYDDKDYFTSGVSEGYNPKYVYYGPVVAPVDMIIYMGGEDGYAGAVDENGVITDTTTLPIPGFRISLPEDLMQRMKENGDTIENLVFQEKGGTKQWKAESYDGTTQTVFKINPTGTNTDPVRVRFFDGNDYVVSDWFDVGQYVNQEVEMSIYPGDPGNAVTAVTITYDGYTYDVDLSGTATLTVRGTTKDVKYSIVKPDGTKPANGKSGVTAPDNTVYYINGKEVVATNTKGIALLFDDIIDTTSTSNDRTAALTKRTDKILGETENARHYELKYLDLVDRNNGDAWVMASNDVTVYWPLPEGTTKDTEFTLLHFKDLHRDMSSDQISGEIENCEVEKVEAVIEGDHIKFTIGSGGFSPFALVWETVDESEPWNPDDGDTDSLQTGDNSNMALWIVLLFVSGTGLFGATAYNRKKKYRK